MAFGSKLTKSDSAFEFHFWWKKRKKANRRDNYREKPSTGFEPLQQNVAADGKLQALYIEKANHRPWIMRSHVDDESRRGFSSSEESTWWFFTLTADNRGESILADNRRHEPHRTAHADVRGGVNQPSNSQSWQKAFSSLREDMTSFESYSQVILPREGNECLCFASRRNVKRKNSRRGKERVEKRILKTINHLCFPAWNDSKVENHLQIIVTEWRVERERKARAKVLPISAMSDFCLSTPLGLVHFGDAKDFQKRSLDWHTVWGTIEPLIADSAQNARRLC